MPFEKVIDLGAGVCLSCWYLLLGTPLFEKPIVVALFLEVWIREQGPDSVIHTYPSKLLDRGLNYLVFVLEGIDWGHTVSFELEWS